MSQHIVSEPAKAGTVAGLSLSAKPQPPFLMGSVLVLHLHGLLKLGLSWEGWVQGSDSLAPFP